MRDIMGKKGKLNGVTLADAALPTKEETRKGDTTLLGQALAFEEESNPERRKGRKARKA